MTIETSYSRKPVRFRFAGKATSAWKRQVLWRARARDPSHADELFIPRAHKNRTGEKTVCWLHIFGSFFLPKKNIAEISRWDPPSMVNQPSVNKCCYCCFLAWERERKERESYWIRCSFSDDDSFAENAKSFDAFVLTGFIKMSEKVTSSAEMLSLKILRFFFQRRMFQLSRDRN